MKDKKITRLSVRTNSNGYTLSYEGMSEPLGFFYFDAETLVAGLFKHIVLGEHKAQDPDMCRALLQSMATWTKTRQLHTANATLMAETQEAKREAHVLRLQIYQEHKKRDELIDEIQELKIRLALANVKINNYERLKAEVERNARKAERHEITILRNYEKEYSKQATASMPDTETTDADAKETPAKASTTKRKTKSDGSDKPRRARPRNRQIQDNAKDGQEP